VERLAPSPTAKQPISAFWIQHTVITSSVFLVPETEKKFITIRSQL